MSYLLLQADARRIPLADRSVHCVVTSPPYWGLRDYGTARWEGGDEGCDHRVWRHEPGKPTPGGRGGSMPKQEIVQREHCSKCGASRIDRQIGLEATPGAFVAEMVRVFREVRRVLRDDGTLWLNLGDSYATGSSGDRKEGAKGRRMNGRARPQVESLKPKDLIGIPWRVALALQADGWYLRSDIIEEVEFYCPCGCGHVMEERIWRYSQDREIIWAKPNPMPESVRDRPTKSHEYLFLMSKGERYFYDADAVREDGPTYTRRAGGYQGRIAGPTQKLYDENCTFAKRDVTTVGRNARTVWTIATEAYPGAHFATFPRRLVEPCVRAGTSEKGVCPECGKGWERVVERERYGSWTPERRLTEGNHQPDELRGAEFYANYRRPSTLGWRPACSHGLDPVPAIVLDPFAGSGTTLQVADALGRHGVGCDLSREYLGLASRRLSRPHSRVPRPERKDEVHPLFDMAECDR